MPLPIDLSLLLVSGLALGLGLSMLLAQAIGGAIGALILEHRHTPPKSGA